MLHAVIPATTLTVHRNKRNDGHKAGSRMYCPLHWRRWWKHSKYPLIERLQTVRMAAEAQETIFWAHGQRLNTHYSQCCFEVESSQTLNPYSTCFSGANVISTVIAQMKHASQTESTWNISTIPTCRIFLVFMYSLDRFSSRRLTQLKDSYSSPKVCFFEKQNVGEWSAL